MLGIKRIRNNRGNSILTVLSLMAVAVAGIQVSYFNTIGTRKALKYFKTTSARTALIANIRDSVSMVATYRTSMHPSLPATENSELKSCILGNSGNQCQAGVELPLTLYSPTSASSVGELSLQKISGPGPVESTSAQPLVYSTQGAVCSPDKEGKYATDCTIEVYTTFTATCAGGAEYCSFAEGITVRYYIKNRTETQSTDVLGLRSFATLDKTTNLIDRDSILPALMGSSSTNIAINTLNVVSTIETVSTTPSPTSDPYAGLNTALVNAVIAGGFTGENTITEIVKTLEAVGMTDVNFITSIATVYPYNSYYDFNELIRSLAKWNVTDVALATFLSQSDTTDADWMKIVIDSGVRDAYLVGLIPYYKAPETPRLLANMSGALEAAGLTSDYINVGIVAAGVTDPAIINTLYTTLKKLENATVAGGIVDAGFIDPIKVAGIVDAISGIDDFYIAFAVSRLGITNQATAETIESLVSTIDDTRVAGDIITNSGGDLEKIKIAVANYVPYVPPATSTPTVVAATPTPTPEPTISITASPTPTPSPTVTPSEMTYISTCTEGQCPTISF